MKLFQSASVRWGLFALVVLAAFIRSYMGTSAEKRDPNGYDEQMWTSSSISSYNMYFKGRQRQTKELDNWFATYAWRNKVPVFTNERWEIFKPDTVHFPYDYVTVKQGNQSYSIVVKYDLNKFTPRQYQWYDRDMWTFGWKAPNMGKYIMGWAIQTFGSQKPDPDGYFSYYIPEQYVDSLNSKRNVPSTKLGNATFSYAPEEFVMIGRRVNMLFTVLTIVITFLIGWFFLSYWVGFSAALWLILSKTFVEVNTVVGLDSFAVCFSMAAVLGLLVTFKWLKEDQVWWKVLTSAVVTGLMIAFAISSKLNAGMLIFVAFIIYALAALLLLIKPKNKIPVKAKNQPPVPVRKYNFLIKGLASGALIGFFSIAVFVMLNPQVQGDPVGKMRTMQKSIDEYFTRRALNFTQNQVVDRMKAINAEIIKLAGDGKMDMNMANNMAGRLQQVNQQLNVGLANQPEEKQALFLMKKSDKLVESLAKLEQELQTYDPEFEAAASKFMNWVSVKNQWPVACSLVLKRIAVVESGEKDVKYYGSLGSLLKFPYNALDGILAAAGLLFLILMAYKESRKEFFVLPALIILSAFVLVFYGNVDFVWIDWPRYMTPIFPLYALLIGLGIVEGGKYIREKMQKNKQQKAA